MEKAVDKRGETDTAPPVAFGATDFTAVNPQLGIFYKLAPNHTVRATIARKSHFPSIKDRYSYKMGSALPNPDLGAEYATHYEVGYTGAPVEGLRVSAAVYYSSIDDAIQTDTITLDAGNPYGLAAGKYSQAVNTGKAESLGVELAADYDINKHVGVSANYAWVRWRNTQNRSLKPTDIPEHSGLARINFRPAGTDTVTLSPVLEWASKRYASTAGDEIHGYALLHFIVTVKVRSDFTIRAGIKNLLDKNYELSEGYPEAGRTFFANATWTF